MKQYEHVFFDLDHTLWDFEKNSEATFRILYDELKLKENGIVNVKEFYEIYHEINEKMWGLYRKKHITRNELRWKRMYKTLAHFNIHNENLAHDISERYLEILPIQTNLFPFAIEILDYCKNKNYLLHLITNGFEITQYTKLKKSNLDKYFERMITSEQAMSMKPYKEIFEYAFLLTGAKAENSIMIGDSYEADIEGAMNVNMDQIYFNPNAQPIDGNPTFEISCLSEIKNIL